MEITNQYKNQLRKLKLQNNYRTISAVDTNNIIDLCSNDYLGLCTNENLLNDFFSVNERKDFLFSSSSSRLLKINYTLCKELETLIAHFYQKETALIFNSGYHANIGIISTLAGKNDLILADKYVHASIIDGAKLSKATFKRYKHLSYNHLEDILKKNRQLYDNVFIISESIYSMDGDISNLAELVNLKEKYNCLLYIDEAHAIGARGNTGFGIAEEQNCINKIDFIIGTFGKALASLGGFVVCRKIFAEYLINHSRTFIYTTALPPINIAWTKFIFERLSDFTPQRKALENISKEFSKLLNVPHQSHIISYVLGSNEKGINASNKLKSEGFFTLPIRPPTVPEGTSRLRFSLNANLSLEDLIPVKNIVDNENDLGK